MARSRKPRPIPLTQVEPGSVFALPLDDGRWGAFRILRKMINPLEVVVQTSAWIGDAPPSDLSDPLLRAPLILTHHFYSLATDLYRTEQPVPADAVLLGRLPLTRPESTIECNTWASWDSSRSQPVLQWRWDHDREAVLAEDERERQQREAAQQETRFGYQPLSPLSLREMRERKQFTGWSNFVSPENIRRSRQIVRYLIDDLIALEDNGDESTRLDAFRRAVERFNDADERDEPFIMTDEREDICDVLFNIAEAVGLHDYDVASSRDW
jgi:hypothetical protein